MVKLDIRIKKKQKQMLKDLAVKKGITVTALVMHSLYKTLEEENILLDFLNVFEED